ncbi:MAG TPA: hypothetical protein VEU97_02460 [Ktedonobacteraceae bacterium]|nr:hypothetical protein [Ktedonobacteraceae bacterium]
MKERLARTDALIDKVVYRLYGLTEEEIAVVETRTRSCRHGKVRKVEPDN